MKGSWDILAVELGDSSKSGLGLALKVSIGGWEVQQDVRVEAVAVEGL